MDSRGIRRPNGPPQRSLLLTLGLVTLLSSFVVYLLVGRHLKKFDDVAVRLTDRLQQAMTLQAADSREAMASLKTETKGMTETLRDLSDVQFDRFRRLSMELRNHSRLVALAIETQSDLYSAQIRELRTVIRDSTLGQSGLTVREIQALLVNQTSYTLATLRAQRRTEKDLVEIMRLVQEPGDGGGFKASVETTLQEIVSAMERHTQIQEAAQETLDALSALLTTQRIGGGLGGRERVGSAMSSSTSIAEQDKIHAVLKALVAHLRSQEKDNNNSLNQIQVVRRLEFLLAQLRNQTSVAALSREVRMQSDTLTRLRSDVIDFGTKVAAISELATMKKGDGGTGDQGVGARPEIQGAILSLLQEVKRQTAQMQELRDKIETLDDDIAGGGSGGKRGESVMLTLLNEVKSQTKLMSAFNARMSRLEQKAGIVGDEGLPAGVTGGELGAGREESGGAGGTAEGGESKSAVPVTAKAEPKVDVTEPGQWLQHQLAGSPTFMRFSGYRIGDRRMAAVGLATRAIAESINITTCLWMGRESSISGEVELLFTSDDPGRKYEVVLLHCTFPVPVPSGGGYLAVPIGQTEYTLYREEIGEFANLEPAAPYKHKLTICVAPVATPIEANLFREFVEYHRLLGADHFMVYDAGGFGPQFRSQFEGELRSGAVELMPFQFVDKYDQAAGGEILASMDCIYATQYTSRWVAFLEANEYLYVKPPDSLPAILQNMDDQSWLSHGSVWWASQKCREPFEDADTALGDRFSVERMVFRWPFVLCHDTEQYPDRRYCLGNIGNRKLIVNPRKVRRIQLNAPHPEDEKKGTHLSTDLMVHQHYQRLLDGPLCSEVVPEDQKLEWWYRNSDEQDFASQLRKGHRCNFSAEGCIPVSSAVQDAALDAAAQADAERAGTGGSTEGEGGADESKASTGRAGGEEAGGDSNAGGTGGGGTKDGDSVGGADAGRTADGAATEAGTGEGGDGAGESGTGAGAGGGAGGSDSTQGDASTSGEGTGNAGEGDRRAGGGDESGRETEANTAGEGGTGEGGAGEVGNDGDKEAASGDSQSSEEEQPH